MLRDTSSKIEELAINDKLLTFLKQLHELKKYEQEKEKAERRKERRKEQSKADGPPTRLDYSMLLDKVETADTNEINDRIRQTKEHQLRRIDHFLSLESNCANKER